MVTPGLYVRECRGHFHICFDLADGECCDLKVDGDPFPTRTAASIALGIEQARRNEGAVP